MCHVKQIYSMTLVSHSCLVQGDVFTKVKSQFKLSAQPHPCSYSF